MLVGYFYFAFNDSEKQSSTDFVKSLIFQFWKQLDTTPHCLTSLYTRFSNGQLQPSLEDLLATLKDIIYKSRHSYILVDALDECANPQDIVKLLNDMRKWSKKVLHIFIISRQERVIQNALEELSIVRVNFDSDSVNQDIQQYVRARLTSDARLKRWPHKIQDEIKDTLLSGAHGM